VRLWKTSRSDHAYGSLKGSRLGVKGLPRALSQRCSHTLSTRAGCFEIQAGARSLCGRNGRSQPSLRQILALRSDAEVGGQRSGSLPLKIFRAAAMLSSSQRLDRRPPSRNLLLSPVQEEMRRS